MTTFDRVFTRIGANDKILEAKSTFFVELEETKNILDNATKRSLIIMDELGRGTSTFDGFALAKKVFDFLLDKRACMLFTTHYHMLIDQYKDKKQRVALGRMACEYN